MPVAMDARSTDWFTSARCRLRRARQPVVRPPGGADSVARVAAAGGAVPTVAIKPRTTVRISQPVQVRPGCGSLSAQSRTQEFFDGWGTLLAIRIVPSLGRARTIRLGQAGKWLGGTTARTLVGQGVMHRNPALLVATIREI
jgi:hypothetical protein